MTALHLRKSINRSPLRLASILTALALACFALLPQARAVCQEGCDLGNGSTFLGEDALLNNTGFDNTAIGKDALFSNTNGSFNTASGEGALLNNTGFANTATGAFALEANTTGGDNTATGDATLISNTTGADNTAIGAQALHNNTTGSNNTASGFQALFNNTIGNNNIAWGFLAGFNLTTGSNNIYVGNAGSSSGEANKIRIGTTGTQKATFVAGISGVTVPAGVGVIVGTDGKLGTVVSSERFKDEIKPMDKTSEAILALKTVTFRYKHELDPDGILQFGLVAEQVEKVNPDLVARDEQGKAYTVRYEAVNAMLLNEFLKEHQRVQELTDTVAQEREAVASELTEQQNQIKALTDTLQKVSNEL